LKINSIIFTSCLLSCDRTVGHRTVWALPVVEFDFFATVIGFGCALLSITTGNAWRLLLEDREGWSRMSEAARNYGEEWSYNYELRRLGMHGGWGAGNSKAREKVWSGRFLEWWNRASEEVKNFAQSMLWGRTSADCARWPWRCVVRRGDLLVDRDLAGYRLFHCASNSAK